MGIRSVNANIKIKRQLPAKPVDTVKPNNNVPSFFDGVSPRKFKTLQNKFADFLEENLDQWENPPLRDIKKQLHEYGIKFENAPLQYRGYGWFFKLRNSSGHYWLEARQPSTMRISDMHMTIKKYVQINGEEPVTWRKPISDEYSDISVADFFSNRKNKSLFFNTGNNLHGKFCFYIPDYNESRLLQEKFDGHGVAMARTVAIDFTKMLQNFLKQEGTRVGARLGQLDLTQEMESWYRRNGGCFKNGKPVFDHPKYPRNVDHWWE